MTMTMPVYVLQDLRGPHADEAAGLLATAATLTIEQAISIGQLYEDDTNEQYDSYCYAIWVALQETGRGLPLGWFEAIYANCSWVDHTKALHAVADAVMATLVRSSVSVVAYNCLTAPFLVGRVQIVLDAPVSVQIPSFSTRR